MINQSGFAFDEPLTADPVSQLPVMAPRTSDQELVDRLLAVLPNLPDDIDIDAPLLAVGLVKESLTGWHRARALDAILHPLYLEWQAYGAGKRDDGGLMLRYRRLEPLMPCPGYGANECGKPTRGGRRCQSCSAIEDENLWDQP